MVALSLEQVVEMLVAVHDAAVRPATEQIGFLGYCLDRLNRSKAQFLQDLWVDYELKGRRDGFFVEFGGADGVRFSNTYYLETELGWRGIVAEPARVWHPAVRENRACFVDGRCVWTRTGERLVFNEPAIAAHATIDAYSDRDRLAHTRKEGQRYEVETVSLDDLLAHWNAPRRIDYLSVDTEGSELDILKAFDFEAWYVRLITVEHNHSPQCEPLREFLTSKGFRRKFEMLSNVDDWYVRAD